MTDLVQWNNCAGCMRKRSLLSEQPSYFRYFAADPPFMFILKQWHFIFWSVCLSVRHSTLTQWSHRRLYDFRNQVPAAVTFLFIHKMIVKSDLAQSLFLSPAALSSWASTGQVFVKFMCWEGLLLKLYVMICVGVWQTQQILYMKNCVHFNVLPLLFLITRHTFLRGLS